MKFIRVSDIPDFIQHLSYMGIFLWFLFTQLIVVMPIPEEAVLLSIGYVSAAGVWNPVIGGAVAAFTLLFADNIFYFLARSGNRYVRRFTGKAEGTLRKKAESGMRRNMPKTVFTLTFIPRLRFFGPILAGALRLRWLTFFAVDAFALSIFTFIYVGLGFVFHKSMAALFRELAVVYHVLVILALIAIVMIAGAVLKKRFGGDSTRRDGPIGP